MRVMVPGYRHVGGEHCASTAMRNVLDFYGVGLSEAMIFGIGAGLGFFYIRNDQISPSRMFHGRTLGFEADVFTNAGVPFDDRTEPDGDRAWQAVRERIDSGEPVLIATDTFYLGYHKTSSHFPGHRAVVVGYDDATREAFIADRKFPEVQACSYEELQRARNAPDYPMTCDNRFGTFTGPVQLGVPLEDAIRTSLRRNADWMLAPTSEEPGMQTGIGALRSLAGDFENWSDAEDWSWAARFGYQVVIQRGSGGSFFRSIYADYLTEAAASIPAIGEAGLAAEMHDIATDWRELAGVLKEQSERDTCDPTLFTRSGTLAARLADREAAFFERVRAIADA
jgi:hypothetical protein